VAIQFVCPNPRCGKLIQVSADKAGQQIQCPTCRQTVLVPGAVGGFTSRDDAAVEAYQQFLRGIKEHQAPEEDAGTGPPAASKSAAGAPAVTLPPRRPPAPPRPAIDKEDLSGLPRAEVPLPAGAPGRGAGARAWWRSPAPLTGSFWRHCLRGVCHSGVDPGSILAASLCVAILTTYFRALLAPEPLLAVGANGPRGLLLAGFGVLAVLLGGYVLMVCLSLIHTAVASGGRMQTWLRPTGGRVLRTGLLGLAVTVVYLLPVITLPLLPLAVLTLALTLDGRAFCFRWQIRSAFDYGEGFAVLWLVWLLAGAVATALWVGITWLADTLADWAVTDLARPEAAALRAVIWFCGALVATVLTLLPVCGMARCTGLLARFRPGVLESLPTTCRPAVTWAIVLGCVLVAAIVASLWMGLWAAAAAP
jgi:DNA-directed RNA polymerase subunit RPC12/RpoP